MYISIKCPTTTCIAHLSPNGNVIKKGYYKTKYNSQHNPRYFCKCCKKHFSTHTNFETYKQKRPDLNEDIYNLINSGVGIRRIAKLLKCSTRTIQDKIIWLGKVCRDYHEDYLTNGLLQAEFVGFDEQESYIHTRLQPVSLIIASYKTSKTIPAKNKRGFKIIHKPKIIDIQVEDFLAKGHLAKIFQEQLSLGLLPPRTDTRRRGYFKVLHSVKKVISKSGTLVSDQKRAYNLVVASILPTITHSQFLSRKVMGNTGEKEAIQSINFACANMRTYISRLQRKSWCNSKSKEYLQAVVDIHICFNNEYSFSDILKGFNSDKLVS